MNSALSRNTLYHVIERKETTSVNIGGRRLFDRKDLDELIERAKNESPQLTAWSRVIGGR
jgi:excisionase family DNA binding protein